MANIVRHNGNRQHNADTAPREQGLEQKMKNQFKAAYSQIRAGRKIEDFYGEHIPYSVLRAASESTHRVSSVPLETRLANHKTGKLFFA